MVDDLLVVEKRQWLALTFTVKIVICYCFKNWKNKIYEVDGSLLG